MAFLFDIPAQIHPFGRIPALVDGDVTLFENAAILLYLGEKYGGLDTLQKRCVSKDKECRRRSAHVLQEVRRATLHAQDIL